MGLHPHLVWMILIMTFILRLYQGVVRRGWVLGLKFLASNVGLVWWSHGPLLVDCRASVLLLLFHYSFNHVLWVVTHLDQGRPILFLGARWAPRLQAGVSLFRRILVVKIQTVRDGRHVVATLVSLSIRVCIKWLLPFWHERIVLLVL